MNQAVTTLPPARRSEGARLIIVACLMAGTVMQALDSTVANVSLPYMQGSLSASREQITWVLTSYVIAAAIMTAPVGWIAARFGRKNFFICAMIGFTAASILCGASRSLEEIVFFRVLQGVFGAALSPLAQSMMLDLYPPEKRGGAMALYGSGIMLGPILGPTLGGYLTEALNWRWVFYINVPIGIAAIAGLLLFPSRGIRNTAARFDWTGFGFLSVGLGAFQLMLDRGSSVGWFESGEIVLEATVAGLCIYLFIVHMLTTDHPLIPPHLFRDRSFVAGALAMFVMAGLMLASIALQPPYLQNLSGYSVLQTGLIMSPRGFGVVLAMQISSRLSARGDPRLMLALGSILTAYSMWMMADWTPDVTIANIIVTTSLQGFSMGLLFGPINIGAFATLPAADRTNGSAVVNLARNLGGGIGISATTSFMTTSTQLSHANLATHVNPFNRALESGVPGMMWNTATPRGLGAISQVVDRQAQIIAFTNTCMFMALAGLGCLLILFLMRKPKSPPAAIDDLTID